MTSYTVTATQTANTFNGILLRVEVLNNAKAAASQTGATAKNITGGESVSITTTTTGSVVFGAAMCDASVAMTPASGTTFLDNFHDTVNTNYYVTFDTGATGTPGATTVGSTTGGAGGVSAAEILPNGTISVDASSPASVNTTGGITITTASFSPPASTLLVALVSSDGTGSGVTTASVTSSPSLTWTELVNSNAGNFEYTGVWIAQVPSGGTTPPPLPLGTTVAGKRGRKGSSAGSGRPLLHIEEVVQPLGTTVRGKPGRKGRAQGSPAPLVHIEDVPPVASGRTVTGRKARKGSSAGSPPPAVTPPVTIQPPAATGASVRGRKARKGTAAGSPQPLVHLENVPPVPTGTTVRGKPGRRGSAAGSKPIPVGFTPIPNEPAATGRTIQGKPGRKGSSAGSRAPLPSPLRIAAAAIGKTITGRRGRRGASSGSPQPRVAAFVTPQQGTAAVTSSLAATVTITTTLAGSVAIRDTPAGSVAISNTAAGTVNISNSQAGTVTIVNEL